MVFKNGDKVKCLYGDSGHKSWYERLEPFVIVAKTIRTDYWKPDKLIFEEIPETSFYENDFGAVV